MKARRYLRLLLSLLIVIVTGLTGCSVPRRMWPQHDIEAYQLGEPSMQPRILIASRSSDFKHAILAYLELSLNDELDRSGSLYVRFIGIDHLPVEESEDYDAIVILNTCIASGLDPKVKRFLEREVDHDKIILLTTSGDGDWLPDTDKYGVEAISSASTKARVQPVVSRVLERLHAGLGVGR